MLGAGGDAGLIRAVRAGPEELPGSDGTTLTLWTFVRNTSSCISFTEVCSPEGAGPVCDILWRSSQNKHTDDSTEVCPEGGAAELILICRVHPLGKRNVIRKC